MGSQRGLNQASLRKRPPGLPYPTDATFRYLWSTADSVPGYFRTEREIYQRAAKRQQLLKMITVDNDGCWIWVGTINTNRGGTPVYRARYREFVKGAWLEPPHSRVGHPFLWLMLEWFPDEVLKLERAREGGARSLRRRTVATCGKILCIRPQCRVSGIRTTNPARGADRWWHPRSFTPDQVRMIRKKAKNGETLRQIADSMGRSYDTVRQVASRKHYRWVEDDPEGPANPTQRPAGALGGQTGTLGPQESVRGAERA